MLNYQGLRSMGKNSILSSILQRAVGEVKLVHQIRRQHAVGSYYKQNR